MIVISAMYHFVTLDNYRELQPVLLKLCQENKIKGTLLLAHEGINGTVAGSREGIDNLYKFLELDGRFEGKSCKESFAEKMPFYRLKIKLKKEIVTIGVKTVDPNEHVGEYIEPKDWNDVISDPNTILIDTRNDYEIGIGTFKGAVDPRTTNFREFPEYVKKELSQYKNTDKKIAMYCTGGIRCEKSTAYLLDEGFDNVCHLKGGILNYFKEVPEDKSLWDGECFVFDGRVSVDHNLNPGTYEQCYACRWPVSAEEQKDEKYQPGISCPRCYDNLPETTKARAVERQKQIVLAKERGEQHIG